MKRVIQIVCVAVVVVVGLGSVSMADVFNMGPGLTSLEIVPVGNPGNADDQPTPAFPEYYFVDPEKVDFAAGVLVRRRGLPAGAG